MSGNWIAPIEEMDKCPCCDNETKIQSITKTYIGDEPYLRICFTHFYETDEDIERLETECEAFSECGCYCVKIPLSIDMDSISQEWY